MSAMNAGNDILLMPNDLDESVKQIKKALSRKKYLMKDLKNL